MSEGSRNQRFSLEGKVAIVTGGGMGIGKGIARRIAQAGARVMVADMNLEAANEAVAEITTLGSSAAAVRANVSVVEDSLKAVEDTVREFGRLDILVNNAGISSAMPFLDVTEELYDKTLDVNLKGTFFFSQAAAREMIKEGHGGKIINIASTDALHPSRFLSHYGASKGGIMSLTKAMAKEMAVHGILVNAIAPFGVVTPGGFVTFQPMIDKDAKMSAEVDKTFNTFLERTLLQRAAEPEEIGDVAVFLSSPASDYIAGTVIVADGGFLLG